MDTTGYEQNHDDSSNDHGVRFAGLIPMYRRKDKTEDKWSNGCEQALILQQVIKSRSRPCFIVARSKMNFAEYAANFPSELRRSIPGEYENHLLGSHPAINRKMVPHSQSAMHLINEPRWPYDF